MNPITFVIPKEKNKETGLLIQRLITEEVVFSVDTRNGTTISSYDIRVPLIARQVGVLVNGSLAEVQNQFQHAIRALQESPIEVVVNSRTMGETCPAEDIREQGGRR